MNDKIEVISSKNGKIGIDIPHLRLKREWARKGAKIPVEREILKEAIYDPGVEYMFRTGILYIESMEDKIYLGLEEEGTTEPTIIVLNEAQQNRYLTKMPYADFKVNFEKLSKEQQINLANYAIDNQLTDMKKDKLILEATGIDIHKAIELNEADKEV